MTVCWSFTYQDQSLTADGSGQAYAFIPLFIAIANFVVINLVVSVIMSQIGYGLTKNIAIVPGTANLTYLQFANIW